MSQKLFVLSLSISLSLAYFLSSYIISQIGKTKLEFEDWENANIISAVERFDFTGVWLDRSNNFGTPMNRFKTNNGTAHLQIRCDPFDYTAFNFANITFGQSQVSVHFRPSGALKSQNPSVGVNLTLFLGTERVKRSKLLEDLDIKISLLSNEPDSEMDLLLRLNYNNYFNTQGVFRFLSFGFLIGIFEMACLFQMIIQFERRESLCKDQSVIFWTALGMFNCLFCFINITDSTENMQNMSYFFINSMINFVNFGLVILRILHRIGKVQLSEILANSVC